MCQYDGCATWPSYGPPDTRIPVFCRQHCPRDLAYKNVKAKVCLVAGCGKQPSFAPPGVSMGGATHCSQHRLAGHRRPGRSCPVCGKIANFGFPGAPTHCFRHRLPGHRGGRVRHCVAPMCKLLPSFGPPGGSKLDAACCSRHRPRGYINLSASMCEVFGCQKSASFCLAPALAPTKDRPQLRDGASHLKPTRCAAHRPDGYTSRRTGPSRARRAQVLCSQK